MKTQFICSFCFRCVPLGYWFKGHWYCMWCKNLSPNPPEVSEISDLHTKCEGQRVVCIEEIDCGGKL